MKDNLTELVFIIDRSGSMKSIRTDVIGGFNSYLEKQKKEPGEANVTVSLFDDEYVLLYDKVDIKEVKDLTNETFVPRGFTALYDAIGKTINTIGDRLSKTSEEERPGKVLFVIITDGQENASKEFNGVKIKEMIKHQESVYSWDFVFIAANMDAILTASHMGISSNKAMNFSATSKGVSDFTDKLSSYTTSYRSCTSFDKSSIDIKDN